MIPIEDPILQLKHVSISYTPGKNAVNDVNADIKKKRITAIMGPSGCGKSTLLRAINRMHELYPGYPDIRRNSDGQPEHFKDEPHGSKTDCRHGIPTSQPVSDHEHLR